MKTSVTFQKITEAMAKARSKMPPITMDAVNPYHKSKYASLGAVISTIQPYLDEFGLSIISVLEGDGINVGITTRVSHAESGEWVESTCIIPLKGVSDKTPLAQMAGIDFTYIRRYSINALFNLISEEDTDGNVDGYEKPPKVLPKRKWSDKAAKNEPEPTEPAEQTEEERVAELVEEFTHLYNRAVSLGNQKADLPKPSKKPTETEMLEKIAEINLILKESLEGE